MPLTQLIPMAACKFSSNELEKEECDWLGSWVNQFVIWVLLHSLKVKESLSSW